MPIYNKIMIFGRPGSGKSTYAQKLSKQLTIPAYYLDQYFFLYNWQEVDENKFLTIQQNIVNNDKWIIDGNCIHSLEMRFKKADLVLYFSYSKFVCVWRIFKRRLFSRNLIGRNEKCKEQLTWKFIKYTWNFDKIIDNKIKILRIKYPKVTFCKIKDNKDLEIFL